MTHRTKLEPLEPGCLAMVVDGINCREHGGRSPYAVRAYGMVVTVMGRADCDTECCVSIAKFSNVRGEGNGLPVKIRPENLIRIDPDAEQREQWAGEEVGV